jgi:hypothetical protein
MEGFESNIKMICLETDAFKALVSEVATQIKEEVFDSTNPWVDEEEARRLLHIDSKTTLHKYRSEGKIEYSKLTAKKIVYSRRSIMEFIENRKGQ